MEIRKLNSLRGIAALVVVISHFSNATQWLDGVLGSGAGQLGVMLFFILSGFLMSYLYLNKEFNRANINHYVVARVARVAPLFYLVVIVSWILAKAGIDSGFYDINDAKRLWGHLLLLQGQSVLWTIPVEIHFYGLFVLIWWITSGDERWLYVTLVVTILLMFFQRLPEFHGSIFGIQFTIGLLHRLPFFLTGAVLGRLYTHWQVPRSHQHPAYVLGLLCVILFYPEIYLRLTGHVHLFWADTGVLFGITLAFFVIVFLVPDDSRLLANKGGDLLGRVSFSVYLLHIPILAHIDKLPTSNHELQLLILCVTTIGVSFVSYHLIEVPTSKWIRGMATSG